MVVYGTLLLCSVLVGLLIYRYDLYEKEPVWMLVLAGCMGALGMWGIGYLEDWVLDLYGPGARPSWFRALVASSHEESLKVGLVLLLAVLFRGEFEDPTDGLIYGSIVGLGMAIYESVFYLGLAYGEVEALPGAEFVRLFGHPVMGGIGGFGVGVGVLKIGRWGLVLLWTFMCALLIHFVWDWISFVGLREGDRSLVRSISVAGLMLFGFVVYGGLVCVAGRMAGEVFVDKKGKRLWGWPFKGQGE